LARTPSKAEAPRLSFLPLPGPAPGLFKHIAGAVGKGHDPIQAHHHQQR